MNNLKDKKILIFGTGAVGGYYGGMLAKSGHAVTFVAKGRNFEAIKKNGLTLTVENVTHNLKIRIINSENYNIQNEIFDYIFICVKSMDTITVTNKIKSNIGPDTVILSLQNGVENEEIISSIVGKEHVIGGFCYVASQLVEPGKINMLGNSGVTIGEFNREKTKRVFDLQSIIQNSGVNCTVSDDIEAEMWNKLVWNTAFNSLSTLTGKTLDQILENNNLLNQVTNIMNEVRDTAIASGVKIRPDTVEFNLNRSYGYTGFKTSTLQDYERGKPLEIEELVGVIVRKGKEFNIPTPYTEKVYSELKKLIKTTT